MPNLEENLSQLHSTAIEILKERSMLEKTRLLHDEVRKVKQEPDAQDATNWWERAYAETQSLGIVQSNSVWFTAYMPAVLNATKESRPLETLSVPTLWNIFHQLHIDALHTGPVMKSGGYPSVREAQSSCFDGEDDKLLYPTMDGWFDPIGLEIDSQLGSDKTFLTLCQVAKEHGAKIVGDIVPGHTGMGPDFYLALMGVSPYTGLYLMVRVDPLLRELAAGQHKDIDDSVRDRLLQNPNADFRLLDETEVRALARLKLIPGSPQREMGVQAGNGWTITGPIQGIPDADGISQRRWVYLHFFNPKQPTLNWVDPSYVTWRLMNGQLNYVMYYLRSWGVRLDANAFLGIEKRGQESETWSEDHPLSQMATTMLAWQARRLGGFSFQENNMPLSGIARLSKHGPDLSYDFITRPACQHSVLTGTTNLLNFMYCEMLREKIDPVSLIHALQNHDEFTYELVHLDYLADKDSVESLPNTQRFFGGLRPSLGASKNSYEKKEDKVVREALLKNLDYEGPEADTIWSKIRKEMRQKAIIGNDYNRESGNGLCTTVVGLLASAIGCRTLKDIPAEKEKIKRGHVLLAAFNALQPGVFALSGWDLVGALPLNLSDVHTYALNSGVEEKSPVGQDFRWINRGAYKLMEDFDGDSLEFLPEDKKGAKSLQAAESLYGPIDVQMATEDSFARTLQTLLGKRKDLKIAYGKFGGIVNLDHRSLFAMLTWLPESQTRIVDGKRAVLAVFNFSQMPVTVHQDKIVNHEWFADWSVFGNPSHLNGFDVTDAFGLEEVASFELRAWDYKLILYTFRSSEESQGE